MDGQVTKWRRNVAENFNRLSRMHERYRRQTTDGRATACSERSLNSMSPAVYWQCVPCGGTGM